MKAYHIPDPRWSLFRANTYEAYLETMLVKGRFHTQVPKDVVDAFEVVEYLSALAYYKWEIYDEAVNKAFRILEMAVKQKAKEADIPLSRETRRGRVINRPLSELIEDLLDKPHLQSLKGQFDRAREMRNFAMHADSNMYMGGTSNTKGNLILFVNIINQLFLDDEFLLHQDEETRRLQAKIEKLQNKALVFEKGETHYLLKGILYFKLVKHVLFLVCDHVLDNAYETLSQHTYSPPMVLALNKYEIDEGGIRGSFVDGGEMSIQLTDKEENMAKLEAYQAELEKLSDIDKTLFIQYLCNTAQWDVSFWEYMYKEKIY